MPQPRSAKPFTKPSAQSAGKKPTKKASRPVPPAPTALGLRTKLRAAATPEQEKITRAFFKTGPGEYAAGDAFIGVTQAVLRQLVKEHLRMPLTEIASLLKSKVHEDRHAALLILVTRFNDGGPRAKQEIFDFYMANLRHVDNWDLVDATAAPIVGEWLADKDRAQLYTLAKSANLWERRIAMIATLAFIKRKETKDTFALAEGLLGDTHELIQKAAGWMLRETGKISGIACLEVFLKHHAAAMPAAMLRAAVDALPPVNKAKWLALIVPKK